MNDKRSFTDRSIRWMGLVEAAGVMACVFTLFGFLGKVFWSAGLTSHFRVQYAAGLLVLAVFYALFRRWRLVLSCVAFSLLNAVVVISCLAPVAQPEATGPTCRILLSNVLTSNLDTTRLIELVKKEDPDLLVFQEMNWTWSIALKDLLLKYPHRIERPRSDNFGNAIFSKYPLSDEKEHHLSDSRVPSLSAAVEKDGTSFYIFSTHPLPPGSRGTWKERNQQLAAIPDVLKSTDLPIVLIGDFNATPWSAPYRRLLGASGLRDSLRGQGLQATWPTHLVLLRIPLDHVFVSSEIRVQDRRVGPNIGSDHFPLIVDLQLP